MQANTEGPCVFCGKHIEYTKMPKYHQEHGDEWIQHRIEYYKSLADYRLERAFRGQYRAYVCDDCYDERFKPKPIEWVVQTPQKPSEHSPRYYDVLQKAAYQEFLETKYWRKVRELKLELSGATCEICGSTNRICVHHKTYAHHGAEHKHLDDLQVLCKGCHEKAHSITRGGD